MRLGVPELAIIFLGLAFWILPVAAGIWALVMLVRIRQRQDEILSRLDALVRTGTRSQA